MTEIVYSKKQINPLIEKYKINPETNETFKNIITMFDGQTPYQIWAIKAVFGNVTTMQNLIHIKAFADENQTLIASLEKQNLVSYKTPTDFMQLHAEIQGALGIARIKKCIETFNTKQRDMLKSYVFGGKEITPLEASKSSTFKKHLEFFTKFDTLSDSRKHKLIVTASAINEIEFLIKHISDSFNATYSWEKDDLLSFIQRNDKCKDVQVVYNNGPIVILEIPNFEASKTICGSGRTSWCITRESSYFNSYVKNGNRQFFYFDFSKDERNEVAHVGFTVNKSQGIVNAHSTNNNTMLGSGIRINSQQVTVHSLLKAANVDHKVFIHLNGIKGFKWDLNDIIAFINKHSSEIQICYNNNGRIIVQIKSQHAFNILCGNTLVNQDSLDFSNGCIFTILDLNLASNDDNCMVTMQFGKDTYGTLSLKKVMDAYNNDITKSNYLDSVGIATSSFLPKFDIKSSVLLHKYLDQNCDTDAENLIKSNPKDLDINYEFNQRTPIFTAIANNMPKAFKALIQHPNFNGNTTDAFGEPLLMSVMYDYRAIVANGNDKTKRENCAKMIETIINTPNYDFNVVDINLDNAINIAAERAETNWILDILVKNPNVNVNAVNDINCTALGNAIRCNNKHAIEMLGKRPDLVVRKEDYELAQKAGINLDSYIKPTSFPSNVTLEVKDGEKTVSNVDAKEYAKIFAQTFASRN